MSGHDLAREPGLGEQRDHGLGEMPLPVQPVQPLIGAKRLRDAPGPSHSAKLSYPQTSSSIRLFLELLHCTPPAWHTATSDPFPSSPTCQ